MPQPSCPGPDGAPRVHASVGRCRGGAEAPRGGIRAGHCGSGAPVRVLLRVQARASAATSGNAVRDECEKGRMGRPECKAQPEAAWPGGPWGALYSGGVGGFQGEGLEGRQRIRDAAFRLFAIRAFQPVEVEEIVAESEVSRTALGVRSPSEDGACPRLPRGPLHGASDAGLCSSGGPGGGPARADGNLRRPQGPVRGGVCAQGCPWCTG